MKNWLLVLLLAISSISCIAQTHLNNIGSIDFSNSLPSPPTVSTSVIGTQGNATYIYWVIANFPNGDKSTPSQPAVAYNSPNTLSGSNYIKVSWNPINGASSYDVLKTTTYTLPQTGNMALVTATTNTSISDTGQTLTSYTLSTAVVPESCLAYYDVVDYSPAKLVIPCLINSGGMTNPMTALGDIIYGGNAGTPARLGIGSNGQVLTIAGGIPSWANGGFTNPMTSAGDIIIGSTGGTAIRLAQGGINTFLSSHGNGTIDWQALNNYALEVNGTAASSALTTNFVAGSNMTITPTFASNVLTLTFASTGGGTGGTATAINAGLLSAIPACSINGQVYVATDQTTGENLYLCTGSPLNWYNIISLGGSGALQITNGQLDINTATVPLLTATNTFQAIQTLSVGSLITPTTFSSLPTCGSSNEGLTRSVTDSTTNTFYATVTGGGTNHIKAYCNGTNWVVD